MPEISRFFGIVIRMFMEVGAPHHHPHFHASYQDALATFARIRLNASAVASLEHSNDSSRRGPRSTMWNCWVIGRSLAIRPVSAQDRAVALKGTIGMSHAIRRVEA